MGIAEEEKHYTTLKKISMLFIGIAVILSLISLFQSLPKLIIVSALFVGYTGISMLFLTQYIAGAITSFTKWIIYEIITTVLLACSIMALFLKL
jgi:hypothetical protein